MRNVRSVKLLSMLGITAMLLAFVSVSTPTASAAEVRISWWRAYYIDEWLCNDLVVEWKVSRYTTWQARGANADAQRVIDRALFTREVVNGQEVVRMTAGGSARDGTIYGGCFVGAEDAARLGNDVIFTIFV